MGALILRSSNPLLFPSHYWTFGEDTGDARWDYVGDAHAMPYAAAIPVVETTLGNGVQPVDGTSISAKNLGLGGSQSFTLAVWAQTTGNNDDAIISSAGGGLHVKINFGASTRFTFRVGGSATNVDLSYGASAGSELKLYWYSYDAATLTARAAINDSDWSSATLSDQLDAITELFFGTGSNRLNGETIIAEAVVWYDYIPTDEDRDDVYANWRDRTYFNNVSATPPAGPFTDVTLVNMEFISDATLDDPGTYFLRPYPLHAWDSVLAAEEGKGDYVWMRSTDHGAGGLFIGYSDSPAVAPTSWTLFLSDDTIETPDLTYHPGDPDGKPFYVSAHIVDLALTAEITGTVSSQAVYQTTVLYRSADLETWEAHGTLLPNTPYMPLSQADMYNHTGYMVKTSWGDGTWRAYSLLSDGWPSSYTFSNALLEGGGHGSVTHSTGRVAKNGWWSSEDGLEWTLLSAAMPGKRGFFSMGGQRYAILETNNGNYNLARVYKLTDDGDLIYPGWPIENWLMSDHGGVWIQTVHIFCEGDTAHIYIKHGYQEPNGVIAYYTATLSGELDDVA